MSRRTRSQGTQGSTPPRRRSWLPRGRLLSAPCLTLPSIDASRRLVNRPTLRSQPLRAEGRSQREVRRGAGPNSERTRSDRPQGDRGGDHGAGEVDGELMQAVSLAKLAERPQRQRMRPAASRGRHSLRSPPTKMSERAHQAMAPSLLGPPGEIDPRGGDAGPGLGRRGLLNPGRASLAVSLPCIVRSCG